MTAEESTDPAGTPEDPAAEQAAGPEGSGREDADTAAEQEKGAEPDLAQQLAERTADLQRVHAEYQNYRKRVERDRALARTQGASSVLKSLLTVLDDIGRAEQHGELEGGFKAVADQLRQVVTAQGLESFGAEGDVFDPRLHEALFQVGESAEVTTTTVGTVVRTGYRVGEEVLRDAQVGVLQPAETQPDEESGSGEE
ncbi:nucleotide exchange factor GrpE [Aeromicrobium halocynthiae]|uniref:Protein GrpE n=1 Tax=Aeromicrobium halocynthiae TaxID=560557 RepID=A0ABN2W3S5_9ACTN